MFKLRTMIATFVLALTGGIANADTYQIFDLSASGGPFSSVSGTITVDQTADVLTAFSISTVPATAAPFTNLVMQGQVGSDYDFNLKTVLLGINCKNFPTCTILTPAYDDLNIAFADGGNLSSFTGGPLDPGNSFIEINTVGLDATDNYYDLTGTLVSSGGAFAGPTYVAATPLPATLPLFATGVGALGLFGWRRKRKNAAALAAA